MVITHILLYVCVNKTFKKYFYANFWGYYSSEILFQVKFNIDIVKLVYFV